MLTAVLGLAVIGAAAAVMRSTLRQIDRASTVLRAVPPTVGVECVEQLDAASHRLLGAVERDQHR